MNALFSSASSQCQSAEGDNCRAVNSGALGSIQFKMVSMHSEKPMYTTRCLSSRWYLCIRKIPCTLHAVSVQDGIYAFRKAHVPPPCLSEVCLWNSSNVCLIDDVPLLSFQSPVLSRMQSVGVQWHNLLLRQCHRDKTWTIQCLRDKTMDPTVP